MRELYEIRYKASLLTISLFLLTTAVVCQSTDVIENDHYKKLIKSIQSFNMAFADCNIDVLESMITNDYSHTNGSSKAIGKEEWLSYLSTRQAEILSGQLKILDYKMEDINISIWDSAAAVTGKVVSEFKNKDGRQRTEIRVTNLWVLHEDEWKRACFHDTRIK